MDKMRYIRGSRSAVGMMPSPLAESRSIFHINSCLRENLTQEMQECYLGIDEFRIAMKNLDGAGTHLTESLAQVLRGTSYQQVGEQLSTGFREVYGSQVTVKFLEQLKEMEAILHGQELPSEDNMAEYRLMYAQKCCHVLLLFAKLQKQYFHLCHQKISDLIHHFLAAKDPNTSTEVTKFILKLGLAEELSHDKTIVSLPNSPWSSPKLRKASQSHSCPKVQNRGSGLRFFSLFERKSSPVEGKSAFYVSVPENDAAIDEPLKDLLVDLGPQSVTAGSLGPMMTTCEGLLLGSVPLVTRTDEMNNECTPDLTLEDSANGHLASEDDIDCVINLLSGVGCTSPAPSPTAPLTPNSMLSIPEDPLRDTSPSTPNSMTSGMEAQTWRSPMQLTVPTMYRMPSPASDTQVEELHIPRMQAQVHRRSEGCLDLSGVGRSTWPHQQHHHHRASLPAVQLHTPFRRSFDPFPESTAAPTGHFQSQDFSVPLRPPPGYVGSSGTGMGSRNGSGSMSGFGLMTSGQQWSSYGGGCGLGMKGSGTWPLYHPVSMPLGDSLNNSWSGTHDGSDGSDDSSNGDHFFAVGKDLVNAIDSRHESSDEETDGGKNKHQKDFFDNERPIGCTNTWPMMQHLPSTNLHYQPTVDFPDLLQHPHRPLHMQWSDPVATCNVWSAGNPGVAGYNLQPAHSNSHGFGQHS